MRNQYSKAHKLKFMRISDLNHKGSEGWVSSKKNLQIFNNIGLIFMSIWENTAQLYVSIIATNRRNTILKNKVVCVLLL